MNDYSMGALEALSWARIQLRKCDTQKDYEKTREEIGEMMIKLVSGAAVSFRDKVELSQEI